MKKNVPIKTRFGTNNPDDFVNAATPQPAKPVPFPAHNNNRPAVAPEPKKKRTRLVSDINEDLHVDVKIQATRNKEKLWQLVERALQNELDPEMGQCFRELEDFRCEHQPNMSRSEFLRDMFDVYLAFKDTPES